MQEIKKKFKEILTESIKELYEALKVKYVVRGKKRIKKYKSTRKNCRVEYKNGKPVEVRMTAAEKRHRKIGQRKGKIKRKAKERLIELKRKKSFIARKNMGLKYNKVIPDRVENRKPYKSVKNKTTNNYLSPKFENFNEYYNNQLLLFEMPQNIIWSDKDRNIEIGWDFCSEVTENGEWLLQLVDLYRYGKLNTLRYDRNQFEIDDGFISNSHLSFTNEQIDEITKTLCTDYWFIQQAKYDYKLIKDKKILDDIKKYLPNKLYRLIVN